MLLEQTANNRTYSIYYYLSFASSICFYRLLIWYAQLFSFGVAHSRFSLVLSALLWFLWCAYSLSSGFLINAFATNLLTNSFLPLIDTRKYPLWFLCAFRIIGSSRHKLNTRPLLDTKYLPSVFSISFQSSSLALLENINATKLLTFSVAFLS